MNNDIILPFIVDNYWPNWSCKNKQKVISHSWQCRSHACYIMSTMIVLSVDISQGNRNKSQLCIKQPTYYYSENLSLYINSCFQHQFKFLSRATGLGGGGGLPGMLLTNNHLPSPDMLINGIAKRSASLISFYLYFIVSLITFVSMVWNLRKAVWLHQMVDWTILCLNWKTFEISTT
jgi:hypothetical protein